MNISDKVFLILFLTLVPFNRLVFAEDNGQIININQNYQIAFTDMDNQSLKQGDIVKVFLNETDFIFMQVLESSPILSKLGISQVENFKTNQSDLQRITVGNKVVVIPKSNTIEANNIKPEASPEPKNVDDSISFKEQIKQLMDQLKAAKDEIGHLHEINLYLKTQIVNTTSNLQPKKTVDDQCQDTSKDNAGMRSQLKDRLVKMQQLLNSD